MESLSAAVNFLKRGKLEEGVVILQKLRETDPDNADVLYNLGMAYSDMGLISKAIATLQPCVSLRGEANDHTALGMAFFRNEQPAEAIQQFERSLEIEPDNFYALRNLAAILAQQGQLDDAIEKFQQAFKINPAAPDVAYGLGKAYEEKGEIGLADEWYNKTLAIPGTSDVRELAKEGSTRLAHAGVKRMGFNMAAMYYCLDALGKYEGLSQDEVRTIAFDVALRGQRGLDVNDPEKQYTVKSLPGEYSGLQMVCFMYVGFQIVEPTLNPGIDLADEYQMALDMHNKAQGESA